MKKIEVVVFLIELRKVYYLSSLVKFVHIYSKLKNCKLEVKLVFFWKSFFIDSYDYVSILPTPPTHLISKRKHLATPTHPPF